MPKYIAKALQWFGHKKPKWPQHSPFRAQPKKYDHDVQDPIPDDKTEKLDEKDVKKIQQVIGAIWYCTHICDMTPLVGLSSLASKQTGVTVLTNARSFDVWVWLLVK